MKRFLLLCAAVLFVLQAGAQETEDEEDDRRKKIDVYSTYTFVYVDFAQTLARKASYSEQRSDDGRTFYTRNTQTIAYGFEFSVFSYGRLYRYHYKELKGDPYRTLSINIHPTIKVSMVESSVGTHGEIGYLSFHIPVSWNINSGRTARVDGKVTSGKVARTGFSYGIGFQTGVTPLFFDGSSDLKRTIFFLPMINTERTRHKDDGIRVFGFQMGYWPQSFNKKVTDVHPDRTEIVSDNKFIHHAFLFRMYYGGFSKTRRTKTVYE